MIRCVYKNQKPVTYDIPKPKKMLFTETDLYNFDKKSFGSLIGPLTNHGTSIIALISYYRDRYNKYHDELDLRKLRLLEDRLKMVCAGQSRQIKRSPYIEIYKSNVVDL